ncbi:LysR family transcriptional regulator [Uruburuella testudinis]|uniref:LysR family transcriptional regulator n=1 Tax=Uruburuella testudinis TaxID=1282863 RepID=A0ABY4DUE8_9NEIS|nr:LysR family transcriptional regulator [Uruburuella testudinis]UOO82237.1 LysR family transcriptional regulator [Uruburuella testudinis]
MDFKSLHCFIEVVRLQSFSAAADKLHLTQPTVSKIILALEQQLGIPLLYKESGRKKRQVTPTPIGTQVYRHALNLLHERDLLLQDIHDYRQIKTGTLRIGISLLGSRLLTDAFFAFRQAWPGIELSFLEEGSLAIEKALRNNELDVGQLLAPVSGEFDSIPLCDYRLMVLMRRDALRHNHPLPLRSLQHEAFILFGENFSLNDMIQTACQQQGFAPNVVCRTSQWDLLANMVERHMGIALLPEYYTRTMNPEIFAAVPLTQPEIRWQLAMGWKKHQQPSPALRAWLDIVRSQFPMPST